MSVPAPLTRAVAAMAEHDVAALLVGPGSDLRYLTGYDAPALERMTLLVARQDGQHRLIVPELEEPRAREQEADRAARVVTWPETQDPFTVAAECLTGIDATARLAVGDRLWATFLLGLQRLRPRSDWVRASLVTGDLRMRKSPDEVAALRRAGAAIDRVHARLPATVRPGRREREVARDIADLMIEEGHDRVGFAIVASGPNGASPHHEASERTIRPGDAVVVDIGGPVQGWFSDCTRNLVVGAPPDGYEQAFRALRRAQEAAIAAVRPGTTAAAVDGAARSRLERDGYGASFIHRTGHGIGLDVHEEPYIVAGSDLVLEAGMTFSIEPGVYLPDRFGIRIEDIVAVTADGAERLNTGSRDLVTV